MGNKTAKTQNAAIQQDDEAKSLIAMFNTLRKQIAELEAKENDATAAIMLPGLRNTLADVDNAIQLKQGSAILDSIQGHVSNVIRDVPMPLPTYFIVKVEEDGDTPEGEEPRVRVTVERSGKIKPSKNGGTKTRKEYNATATKDDVRVLVDTISVIMGYRNASKVVKDHLMGCLALQGKTVPPGIGQAVGYYQEDYITSALWGEIGVKGGPSKAVGNALMAFSKDDDKVNQALVKFGELFKDQMVKDDIIKANGKVTKKTVAAFLTLREKDAHKALATER